MKKKFKDNKNKSTDNKKEEKKNPVGRPPTPYTFGSKEINIDQVIYWISIQSTEEEIAGSFHVDTNTLNDALVKGTGKNFSELKKLYSGLGKTSLRRMQYDQAEKSASMAIWLGKQWLSQRDSLIEANVTENTLKHYEAVMNQLNSMRDQSQRKIEDSSSSAEQKS